MKKIDLSHISRRKTVCIVISIALIQFVILILEFCYLKNGYSGDEVYSYATANSSQSMNPLIDMDGTLHINEWLTQGQLFESVTASQDEVLGFDHINEILREDAHPPLYFYLLHFFSCFFIDKFSWIPSIIINSISIFVEQIFFYRLFLLISNDRFRSIIAMCFFGFSSAIINMMTFARNYTLLTALSLIFTYYLFRSIQQQTDREKTQSIVLSSIFLYFAAMTQYFSILYGFFVILFVCLYHIIKKDIKNLLRTGLTMIASIVLMILSFPNIIHQLSISQTSMENATEYPFLLELRVSLYILLNEIFGLSPSIQPSMFFFWIFWGMTGVLVICLIIGFLFRNDEWFINIQNKTLQILKRTPKKMVTRQSFLYFSLLSAVLFFILITSYRFKMFFYYPNSNRYMYIIYPYVALIVLVPLFNIIRKQILQIILVIGLSCMSLSFGKKTNIDHSEMRMKEVVELLANSDVMVVVPNYYSINNSILYLEKCSQVFYTTTASLHADFKPLFDGLSYDKPLYLIYCWPSFNNEETGSEMLLTLKDLNSIGITKTDDNVQYYGAEPLAGISGHVIFRLR